MSKETMTETQDERQPTRGEMRTQRLYNTPIGSATLGSILDFLEEFHHRHLDFSLPKNTINVNCNIH